MDATVDVPVSGQQQAPTPQPQEGGEHKGANGQSANNADLQSSISEQINELKRMQQQIEQDRTGFMSQKSELEQLLGGDPKSFREQLQKDPIATLQRLGLNQDQLVERLIGDDMPKDPQEETKKIIDDLKTQVMQTREETEQKLKSLEEQKINQQISGYKQSILNTISTKKDEWNVLDAYRDEQTGENPMVDRAFDLIQKHFEETTQKTGRGEVLPLDKALEQLQNKTVENFKALFTRSPKIRTIAQQMFKELSQQGNNEPLADMVSEPQKTPSQSMSNDWQESVSGGEPTKGLSKEESILRAASLLKFV